MMQKYRITIPLLLSALLLGGLAACNRSDSSAPSQAGSTQTDSSSATSANSKSQSSETAGVKPDQATVRARREAIRKQIETVLTQDQIKQLQTKLQQGERMRQALSELNLTTDQTTKVQEIFKAARTKRQKPAQEGSQ